MTRTTGSLIGLLAFGVVLLIGFAASLQSQIDELQSEISTRDARRKLWQEEQMNLYNALFEHTKICNRQRADIYQRITQR